MTKTGQWEWGEKASVSYHPSQPLLWEASYFQHVGENQGKVEDLETPHLYPNIAC